MFATIIFSILFIIIPTTILVVDANTITKYNSYYNFTATGTVYNDPWIFQNVTRGSIILVDINAAFDMVLSNFFNITFSDSSWIIPSISFSGINMVTRRGFSTCPYFDDTNTTKQAIITRKGSLSPAGPYAIFRVFENTRIELNDPTPLSFSTCSDTSSGAASIVLYFNVMDSSLGQVRVIINVNDTSYSTWAYATTTCDPYRLRNITASSTYPNNQSVIGYPEAIRFIFTKTGTIFVNQPANSIYYVHIASATACKNTLQPIGDKSFTIRVCQGVGCSSTLQPTTTTTPITTTNTFIPGNQASSAASSLSLQIIKDSSSSSSSDNNFFLFIWYNIGLWNIFHSILVWFFLFF